MKAAIFRGGDIVVDTIPEPKPAQNQALVKVLACGICGSDLHAAKHSHRMVEVSRAYEQTSKMIDSAADLSRRAVDRLGRVQ